MRSAQHLIPLADAEEEEMLELKHLLFLTEQQGTDVNI